jgi:hypothetical protein
MQRPDQTPEKNGSIGASDNRAAIEGHADAPANPNESFIHVPGGRFRFQVSAHPPVYFQSVSLNPTPDGGVIHRQTALRHQLLNISQTQGKPKVPAHARYNYDRLKLTFSEQRWSARSHLVNLPNALMQLFPFS